MAGRDRFSPTTKRSGTGKPGEDPTNMPGQYPTELFGMAIPQTSGAPGTAPGMIAPESSTNQTGQYPDSDPISGVAYPQGTGAPGTQGRQAGDQAVTGPTVSTDVGQSIYAADLDEHELDADPSRPDGYYPSTTKLPSEREPTSTGAGQGGVRGPGHPNARR